MEFFFLTHLEFGGVELLQMSGLAFLTLANTSIVQIWVLHMVWLFFICIAFKYFILFFSYQLNFFISCEELIPFVFSNLKKKLAKIKFCFIVSILHSLPGVKMKLDWSEMRSYFSSKDPWALKKYIITFFFVQWAKRVF